MHKWCVCWNYTDMEINGFGTSVMCSHSKASCNCAHFQGEMTTFSSRGSSAVAEPEVSPWTTYFQSLHNILTLECGNWRRCLFYAPKSLNHFLSQPSPQLSYPSALGLLLCISVVYRTGFQLSCALKRQRLPAWPLLWLSCCLCWNFPRPRQLERKLVVIVHVPLPSLG